jgi:hypothetical protein
MGHSRRFRHICVTSALPPLTTDVRTFQIGSFVPKAVVPKRVNSFGFDAGCVYDLCPLFCLAIPQ